MIINMKRAKIISAGLAISFLLVHVLMFYVFKLYGVTPMVHFNIFSILFYICMVYVVYKGWFLFYAVAVYLEVLVHMTLAVLLTGWNSGFQITLIGMNVLAFYAQYTGRSLKLNYIKMMPLCILGAVMYLGSCVFLHYVKAPYVLPVNVEFYLSILWGVIVFAINLMVLQLLVFAANSSEEKLEFQVYHDKLTGLPNRYFFSTKMESLIEKKEKYWIAISDIDNFKKINDIYGHNCGDYVLKTIGFIFSKKEVLCCRWGGEEFIFVGKASILGSDPYDFLEGVRKEIESYPFEYDGEKLVVTMTFGLSVSSDEGTIEDTIRDADEKLYIGKQTGKNVVVRNKNVYSASLQSYQDPLTRVKNRQAFDKMLESLQWDIQNKTAQFGIVRVKLRDIDQIASEFGDEKKNEYISEISKVICKIYVNSQVFRPCEDEFVAVLTNRDYYDREGLLAALNMAYDNAATANTDKWLKYNVSCNMAVYAPNDERAESVYQRAERADEQVV